MKQLRFPLLSLTNHTERQDLVELALAQALVARLPGQFPALAALLSGDGPELTQVKRSVLSCLNDDTLGRAASGVCGLSLPELRDLLGELSRRRLSSEQKKRRADYLTRLRNREFGF